MPYNTTRNLIRDVLQRVGEPWHGESDFSEPNIALRYINRAYDILQTGGGELDPAIQVDWYWLRAYPPGAIMLVPEVSTTVTVTQKSTQITFPVLADTTRSLNTDILIVQNEPTAYTITSHNAGGGIAALTAPYIGTTGTNKRCRFAKVRYGLATDCLRLMEPMAGFRTDRRSTSQLLGNPPEIKGISHSRMQQLYPLSDLSSGMPEYFALVRDGSGTLGNTEFVQFNRSGPQSGDNPMLVQYEYVIRPAELVDADAEEPLVPLEHRRVLSDIAAWLIFIDKDDNRAAVAKEMATNSLRSMWQDHRAREGRLSRDRGKILPRGSRRRYLQRIVTAG